MLLLLFVLSIRVRLTLDEAALRVLVEHASSLADARTLPIAVLQELVQSIERLCCQVDESQIELIGLDIAKLREIYG